MVSTWLWSNMIFVLSLYKNLDRNVWKKVTWQGIIPCLAKKHLLQHVMAMRYVLFCGHNMISVCAKVHFIVFHYPNHFPCIKWHTSDSALKAKVRWMPKSHFKSITPPTLKADQVARSEVFDTVSTTQQKSCRQIWGPRDTEQVCPTHLWGAGSADIGWKSSDYNILALT